MLAIFLKIFFPDNPLSVLISGVFEPFSFSVFIIRYTELL